MPLDNSDILINEFIKKFFTKSQMASNKIVELDQDGNPILEETERIPTPSLNNCFVKIEHNVRYTSFGFYANQGCTSALERSVKFCVVNETLSVTNQIKINDILKQFNHLFAKTYFDKFGQNITISPLKNDLAEILRPPAPVMITELSLDVNQVTENITLQAQGADPGNLDDDDDMNPEENLNAEAIVDEEDYSLDEDDSDDSVERNQLAVDVALAHRRFRNTLMYYIFGYYEKIFGFIILMVTLFFVLFICYEVTPGASTYKILHNREQRDAAKISGDKFFITYNISDVRINNTNYTDDEFEEYVAISSLKPYLVLVLMFIYILVWFL